MREVLRSAKPDLVLVHGDTTTSTAAALAAYYEKITVGHVEAGLRTYNIYCPFPEEMNRHITGCIASYHFAPTTVSEKNLLNEGIKGENIFVTGNTVIDALNWVLDKIKKNAALNNAVFKELIVAKLPKEKLDSWLIESNFMRKMPGSAPGRKLVLITGHRRENFGQGFINISEAILELSILFPDADFVYPMHLNPNVRSAINHVFGDIRKHRGVLDSNNIRVNLYNENVYFIEPLEYLQFVSLMNLSYLVLTDSGGLQEEAPGLGKPVLVMRDTTERPEALAAGTVRLVGTDKQRIIDAVSQLILKPETYEVMTQASNPYGDGKACSRILEALNTPDNE
jgi:UDP-N-acetylglucosamine 2-epimerase (non-hydrolysing)